jgi:hypothetical protein
MTTSSLKKKLVTAINREEDKGVLEFFFAVLEQTSGPRISKKQYNLEIEAAKNEIEAGKVVSHSTVIKNARKWLKRKSA